MSRDSRVGSSYMSWYQQKAGERPKFLLYDNNNNGRFSGTIDSSANAAYLTVTNLQADDEGIYYCAGANSQITLTQPVAQSFPLGQPAKISCTMSQVAQVGSRNIHWYQQKAGESPKHLLYNAGSNGRFTGYKDASTNAAYLTITNLQDEDEAGQPAKISCTMSRDSQVGSYGIFWYQQKAGESPKYLLNNAGSSGRFTGSKDTSANAAYLTVTNLQAEDEADYYCGGAYGSGSNWWYPQRYNHLQKNNQLESALSSQKAQLYIMAWSLLLAFFFLWCTGANSQYTLTQPAAQSFPLGQPAKISCTMSQDSRVGSYYMSWYQQKAGERPKFLLYDNNNNGRFSGTIDTSANAAYLTIGNLQADDEGIYYCGGAYSTSSNVWYPQ
ncbi:uncharacterized protein [Pituophis catenifer annectens]|uniref:uncharacterized protein n=1 Tax=Pituophis catenifer annectens TaxID=94852 RepID=UPI003994D259